MTKVRKVEKVTKFNVRIISKSHARFKLCCFQTLGAVFPKDLFSEYFPHPVMLHIKFDQDWPNSLRDI